MTSRLKTLAGSLAAFLLLAAAISADTVELTKNATLKVAGGQIKGTIASESSTEVKIGTQTVPVEDIASVTYDGTPANFALALTRENGGLLADAADLYKKAASEAAGKPLLTRAAQYGNAHALAELALVTPSRANEAIAALDTFIKSNSSSRQLGPALETLAKLSLQQGSLPKAEAAVAELSKIPWAAERAVILKAKVLGKQNKYDQAIAELDKIIATAPAKSNRLFEAKLAKAESLGGMKKFDESEKLVRDVVKDVPPEDAPAQALAHNTLGDCLRAAGRPKDALFEYLETDILYDKDKEQHQKALAQIAQSWRDLKQDGRADEVMEKLKQLYPNSPYLSQKNAK
jgi:tetratricopeptide (TPR) repeat protein